MKILSKKDTDLLFDNGWIWHPDHQYAFIRYTQFSGTHELLSDEDIADELKHIKNSKATNDLLKNIPITSNKKLLKDSIKQILEVGITEDTLYNFFWRAYSANTEKLLIDDVFKPIIKEAFDEFEKELG
jgi:hypothetical protein